MPEKHVFAISALNNPGSYPNNGSKCMCARCKSIVRHTGKYFDDMLGNVRNGICLLVVQDYKLSLPVQDAFFQPDWSPEYTPKSFWAGQLQPSDLVVRHLIQLGSYLLLSKHLPDVIYRHSYTQKTVPAVILESESCLFCL